MTHNARWWVSCLVLVVAMASDAISAVPSREGEERLQSPMPADRATVQLVRRHNLEKFRERFPARAEADIVDARGFGPIHVVALYGTVDMAAHLVGLGVDINLKDRSGLWTPLLLSMLNPDDEVARYLLQSGAARDERSYRGVTALHYAAAFGDIGKIGLLLEHGADASLVDEQGVTALMVAAGRCHIAACRELIGHGEVSIDLRDAKGATALYYALAPGCSSVARLLIEQGADVRLGDDCGRTPMHMAAKAGDLEIAELLLARGADVNCADESKSTPTIEAASEGHVEMLKWLSDHGADLLQGTTNGMCALHAAAKNSKLSALAWLLKQGIDADTTNHIGTTALHFAAARNHVEAGEVLLNAGADINKIRPYDGKTPLMTAIHEGHKRMAIMLLERGADPNVRGKSAGGALSEAIERNLVDVIDVLIAKGADLNAVSYGRKPIHDAVAIESSGPLKALLAAGAAVTSTTSKGYTPFLMAVARTNTAMADILLLHGSNVNEERDRWTALSSAAWHGAVDNVRYLLAKGADIETRTGFEQTPLIVAARRNQPDVVRLLLESGANPWAETTNHLTAWHIATLRDAREVVKVIEELVPGMPPTNLPLVRSYFELDDPDAREVYVAGYFNEWGDKSIPMTLDSNGLWYAEVDLYDTWYPYKFVVDGQWILDPTVTETEDDDGDPRSVIHASRRLVANRDVSSRPRVTRRVPVAFEYTDEKARTVFVSGEFNGWSTDSLPMNKVDQSTWHAETAIRPGSYGYKLIVNGKWILDPECRETVVVAGVTNSLLVVESP